MQQLETVEARHQYYRQMGWWQGERLEARYARVVADHPHQSAVVDNLGRVITHEQLWRQSASLAAELKALDIGCGDRVVILLPNWAEWQLVFLAVLRAQAVPAPIPITTDPETLSYALDLVDSKLLISGDAHGSLNLGQTAQTAIAQSSCKPGLMIASADGEHRWISEPQTESTSSAPIQGLDHINFTSSTTGRPKAVMHTADTLCALNQTFTDRFALGRDRPIFMPSPLGHSVGAYHGGRLALFTGAPLVLLDRWDPHRAVEMIEEHHCAFTAAATPFLRDLVDLPWQGSVPKLASLSTFICGGAPVPPVLLEQAWEAFPNTFVSNLWGMTEGGLVTCTDQCATEKIISTAGIGLPGLEMRILDKQGKALAAGEEGELAMRGPGVFFGYLGQDDLYQSLMTEDGFFHTEDLARLDEQGYLQITGRLKDLIIRGGVNISPIPIEDALSRHPAVDAVAVIGLPDERLGERICAVVLPKDENPELADLQAFVTNNGLPKRFCPELLYCVRQMPRTAGGKIRKVDLQHIIQENDPNTVVG